MTPRLNQFNISSNNFRLEPRRAQGIQFEHTFDFDDQGILHWIATDGLQEKWRNPHDTKALIVTGELHV